MTVLRKWRATAVVLFLTFGGTLGSESQVISEYQLKAAFLYNFAKFVEWPEDSFSDSDNVLTIGLLGDDPFGEILDKTVRGKAISGRRFEIRRIRNRDEIGDCHMVFVSRSTETTLDVTLDHLKGLSILSVSDIDDFARRGGMINFVSHDDHISFEINPKAARGAGLNISSKLLRVASVVATETKDKVRGSP